MKRLTKQEDFQKRVNTYMKETDKLAKKLKLFCRPAIYFNNKKKRPTFWGRVGLFLLQKSGAYIDTEIRNVKR
jgi:hypothetical protein